MSSTENVQRKQVLFFSTAIWGGTIFLNAGPRLWSFINAFFNKGSATYWMSSSNANTCLMLYAIFVFSLLLLAKYMTYFAGKGLLQKSYKTVITSGLVALIIAYYSDLGFLYLSTSSDGNFLLGLKKYYTQEYRYYMAILVVLFGASLICFLMHNVKIDTHGMSDSQKKKRQQIKKFYYLMCIGLPFVFIFPTQLLNYFSFQQSEQNIYTPLTSTIIFSQNLAYVILLSIVLVIFFLRRKTFFIRAQDLLMLINFTGFSIGIIFIFEVFFNVMVLQSLSSHLGVSLAVGTSSTSFNLHEQIIEGLPIVALFVVVGMLRKTVRKQLFNDTAEADQTTGVFGTARWANQNDLEKIKAYDPTTGPLVGQDNQGRPLFLPMANKLTVSPPGGGKSTSSSIPILLQHEGSALICDVKGELFAVTARFRHEVLKHQVVVIDPFGITKTEAFKQTIPEALLKDYFINPFDWIPDDQLQRDRMINSFASSLVVSEGGYVNHFDENAKILIRGYVDLIAQLGNGKSEKGIGGLPILYHLMSEDSESANRTFELMGKMGGRARAAANQISRVGADERGSILSTSYRQIDWIGDSNIQRVLSKSNFNLTEFIKGNMDIYVILPEDQVKDHGRFFRMILVLLVSLIVRANPAELPLAKMLFLFEEIAQFGAYEDVEQCIEILRARKVIVWAVFQSLKQICQFKKPDLFLTMPLIQVFANSDKDTCEWIQGLAGDKTVFTKTLSTNKGDSKQKMQIFGGTLSSGEGESVHETGAKLIQKNEIRELPKDEQFVFFAEYPPIHCKKARYFEHSIFNGKFDANPVEQGSIV